MNDDDALAKESNATNFKKIAAINPVYDEHGNIIDFETEGHLNKAFKNVDLSILTGEENKKTQSEIQAK